MTEATTDALCAQALALARSGRIPDDSPADIDSLISLAGADRGALVAARDAFARRLRARSDDYEATGALQLLNRALSRYGWSDPYDWRGRFGHRWLIKP
jgi:hypothetical protein